MQILLNTTTSYQQWHISVSLSMKIGYKTSEW